MTTCVPGLRSSAIGPPSALLKMPMLQKRIPSLPPPSQDPALREPLLIPAERHDCHTCDSILCCLRARARSSSSSSSSSGNASCMVASTWPSSALPAGRPRHLHQSVDFSKERGRLLAEASPVLSCRHLNISMQNLVKLLVQKS